MKTEMTEEKKRELQELADVVWDTQRASNNGKIPGHLLKRINANTEQEHYHFLSLLEAKRIPYFKSLAASRMN